MIFNVGNVVAYKVLKNQEQYRAEALDEYTANLFSNPINNPYFKIVLVAKKEDIKSKFDN